MKIFLGGTCNNSKWRNDLIPLLTENNIDYFNPVVDNWNKKAQQKEIYERKHCDFCLYTITPKMTGVYSIAEVVDDSNKRPLKTILIILAQDDDKKFDEFQIKSLKQVAKLVTNNGGKYFSNFNKVIEYLNILQN